MDLIQDIWLIISSYIHDKDFAQFIGTEPCKQTRKRMSIISQYPEWLLETISISHLPEICFDNNEPCYENNLYNMKSIVMNDGIFRFTDPLGRPGIMIQSKKGIAALHRRFIEEKYSAWHVQHYNHEEKKTTQNMFRPYFDRVSRFLENPESFY
jgi:hypothetical protein